MSTHKRRRKYELKARAERREQTRQRIVAATAALHASRGPARTTIADIARLAQVQRLTVYNTFPELQALFGACQGHFLAAHPPPDLSPRAGAPLDGLESALTRLYAWFRANADMERHVYRDRHVVPDLDALMARTVDTRMAALATAHARAIAGHAPPAALKACVTLALRFDTWDLLSHEGLTDRQIARLMAQAVGAARG